MSGFFAMEFGQKFWSEYLIGCPLSWNKLNWQKSRAQLSGRHRKKYFSFSALCTIMQQPVCMKSLARPTFRSWCAFVRGISCQREKKMKEKRDWWRERNSFEHVMSSKNCKLILTLRLQSRKLNFAPIKIIQCLDTWVVWNFLKVLV